MVILNKLIIDRLAVTILNLVFILDILPSHEGRSRAGVQGVTRINALFDCEDW